MHQFVTNEQKIEQIIDKYKGSNFKYITYFYEEIMFDKIIGREIIAYKETKIKDFKFENISELDEITSFKNYKISQISNTGGYSFGFARKEYFKSDDVKMWDIISKRVAYTGGKFYINVPFYDIIYLNKNEYHTLRKTLEEKGLNNYFLYKGKKISIIDRQLDNYSYIEEASLFIKDYKQMVLVTNFIKEIFYALDEENFIDAIAFKYFTFREPRKDIFHFYISEDIKNSDKLSKKFAALLKKFIKKYKNIGLKFDTNHFIMPYDFDSDRVIANVYTSESFNRSLSFFILLYINPIDEILDDFHYCNFVLNRRNKYTPKKDIEFVKSKLNLSFKDFVLEIFNYYSNKENCDYSNFIKSYTNLFNY